MEIYLKHRLNNEYVCIQRTGVDSYKVINAYAGRMIEFSEYEDESVTKGFKNFASQTDQINHNGVNVEVKRWVESSKVQFEVAYLAVKLEMQKFENSINL